MPIAIELASDQTVSEAVAKLLKKPPREAFFKALYLRPQMLEFLKSMPALAHKLATLFGREGKFAPSKEAGFFQ